MNQIKTLERRARAAFHAGIGWNAFWQQHGAEVCRAEPFNRVKNRRLINRLLALLTSGDTNGLQTINTEPWVNDDYSMQST